MSLHLSRFLQLHPGLTDDPLSVLQLSLELAVFSGHLLKQLRHTHTQSVMGDPEQSTASLSLCLLTFLKSFASDPPAWVRSLQDESNLSGRTEQK